MIATGRRAERIRATASRTAASDARGLAPAARERRDGRGGDVEVRFEDVVGDVDEHGAGAPRARERERFGERLRNGVHVAHEHVALRDGLRDRADVGFLKAVGAHQLAAHLAGDRDERDAVHHRVEQSGHQVGRAGTGGRAAHADAARRARVAARREGRRRFVPDEDVPHRMLVEGIVERHDRSARITEDRLDALALERRDDGLRAVHRVPREPGSGVRRRLRPPSFRR